MGTAVQIRMPERRLEEVEASRQWCLKLISRLIHDMSQPLTVLQGEMDLALSTGSNPDEYKEAIGTSLKEIRRLTKLVQRLRELADLEAPVELTRGTPLLAVVLGAADILRPLAESRNVQMVLEAGPECEVRVSEDRLRRAVASVLNKAVGRSSAGDKLLIASSLSNQTASLLIADQGPAIGPGELASLLDPLQRNPAVRLDLTRDGSLEWCLARRVAESVGGAFTVDNRPDRGCEVRVALPVWSS